MLPFSIPLLFSSILTACIESDNGKSDTSTNTSSVNPATDQDVSYQINGCSDYDYMCAQRSFGGEISDEDISVHLVDGIISQQSCVQLCNEINNSYDTLCTCSYNYDASNETHEITCDTLDSCAVEGRGHAEIKKAPAVRGSSDVGCYFAQAYHAESSSVAAFLQLRAELAHHDAPQDLLNRCWQAAKDEVVHARMMAHLAKVHDMKLPSLDFGDFKQRSLFDLALDNAVEGCIFEMYSALKARMQAHNIQDPFLKSTLQRVALDETQHAELAWAIHHHLMSRLSPAEREQIQQAQQQALQQLVAQAETQQHRQAAGFLAIPGPQLARELQHRLLAA